MRLHQPILGELERWSAKNGVTRAEAIRRLVALALVGSDPMKQTSSKSAAKAANMAGEQIDKMANLALPEEERRARKRGLIKGQREFRDMRGGQPKRKG